MTATITTSQQSAPIQHIDVIWFSSMGVFSEPIFSIGFVVLTMKQLALLFTGLLLAYGLATVNPYSAVAVAGVSLIMAFYRPRVMTAEEYLMSAIRFFATRSSRTTEKKHIAAMFADATPTKTVV
ncbi:MAG: hypothetical protein HRF40_14435 [Nitrososphaera sp.]|jgi:hypothetical protein